MSLDEIMNIPVPAPNNAVLFLWATNPFLADALKVVEAWGFEYKTNIVWIKTNLKRPGSGFYIRGRHELLFICTRGSFVPDQNGKEPIGSVVEAPVEEHSKKPDIFYDTIERMYPSCKYLELFARGEPHNEHWTVWGLEVPHGA
jgi:N6-adenosine-specific RNA methylase IME4